MSVKESLDAFGCLVVMAIPLGLLLIAAVSISRSRHTREISLDKRLQTLDRLRDSGSITAEEHQQRRAQILGEI